MLEGCAPKKTLAPGRLRRGNVVLFAAISLNRLTPQPGLPAYKIALCYKGDTGSFTTTAQTNSQQQLPIKDNLSNNSDALFTRGHKPGLNLTAPILPSLITKGRKYALNTGLT